MLQLLYNLYQPDASEELPELKKQVAVLTNARERLEAERSQVQREKSRVEERAWKQVAKLEGQVRSLEEEKEQAEEEKAELEARVKELQAEVTAGAGTPAEAAAIGEENPEVFQRVVKKYHDSGQFLALLEKAREAGIADAYAEWEEKGYLNTSLMSPLEVDDGEGQAEEEQQPQEENQQGEMEGPQQDEHAGEEAAAVPMEAAGEGRVEGEPAMAP